VGGAAELRTAGHALDERTPFFDARLFQALFWWRVRDGAHDCSVEFYERRPV